MCCTFLEERCAIGILNFLLLEKQSPREKAVFHQAIAICLSHQINSVSCVKFGVDMATSSGVAILPGCVRVDKTVPVSHEINNSRSLADSAVEVKLINTWMLTGKVPCLYIVAILLVVEDLAEGNGYTTPWEVVAQLHREGYLSVHGW